jgi:aspartyl-tRNA(Asn)/glutamyl-tRNA(Gln) amidotransferase subunit C
MKLTKKDVLHVAKLARLDISSLEVDKFRKQLSEIVSYVSELDGLDTKGVEPTSQTTGLVNVYRLDLGTKPSLTVDKALSGTDKNHNGYFVVPQVVTKEE